MAGHYIQLPITVPVSTGAPKLTTTPADLVAGRISSIKHSVAARSLEAIPGTGGVSGFCRVTGLPLTPKGTGQAALSVTSVGGLAALGSGGQIVPASLALPLGSFGGSYTLVLALALDSGDRTGASVLNLISGFNGETYIRRALRYYGQASTAPGVAGKMVTGAGDYLTVAVDAAATTWQIVTVDYNSVTKKTTVAINQIAVFTEATDTGTFTPPAADAYFELGYHLSNNSMRNSKFGDLYVFGESLFSTDFGKSQLSDLVATMKTYYGIA